MVWNPPGSVVAAGNAAQGRIAYVGGSQILDQEVIQRAPWPGAGVLAAWIMRHFEGVYSVGLRRGISVQRPVMNEDGSLRRRDIHEEGRALDVMIRSRAAGEVIANWLVLNAQTLGIQLVIWDNVEWSPSGSGAAWESYTGRDPHTSHVHAEVTPAWAESADKMTRALAEVESGGVSSTWLKVALAAAVVGAGVAVVYRDELKRALRKRRL